MSDERLRRACRVALRAWPREVRDAWGADMEDMFVRMVAQEGTGRGGWRRGLLIARGFADAVAHGLRARVRNMRGRPGLFSAGLAGSG